MATEYKLSYTASEIDEKLGKIDDLATKSEVPTKTSDLTNDSGFLTSYTETDPTVPAWAKAVTKPTYTASEVGALPDTTLIPVVPTNISAFANDTGYLTEHQSLEGLATEDYVNAQIEAIPTPDVSGQINTHNTSTSAHADIREQIGQLSSVVASKEQLTPEFANNIEECTDTTKMYVLPDGFIYAYQYVEATGPSYTNLSEMVQENYRMGSGGTLSALTGAVTTDFIPAKKGQTIRFKGFNPLVMPKSKFPYICFYTGASESNKLSSNVWERLDWLHDNGLCLEQDENGVWSYTAFLVSEFSGMTSSTPNGQHPSADTITHIRMCGTMIEGETVIVTVDEEITEGGSTGGYKWANTGHAFVPADYEAEINKKANKTDIPTALKNPFPLTINGVVYDGSKSIDINISSSNETNNVNLFAFENASDNFSWISGSTSDMIYDTSADYGYKDVANAQFVSKKSVNNGRFAVTGGLPTLPAGEYIVSAEVYMPSTGTPAKAVTFGACAIPSNKAQYDRISISAYDNWEQVTHTFTVADGDVAVYIALMSSTLNSDGELYWRNIKVVSAYANENTENNNYSGNILYGKKWVACGDSFTHGGYNTSDGFDSSVYVYQDGRFAGQNIVYPYIIGLRNNMNIVNLATGGQTMAQSSNSFMTRYANIDADADYITIMLGINDKVQGLAVGTLEDSTNTTFCGAFNIAMEHILENHPFAHVGIMVSHGTNKEIMEATRGIAERWGVPYLDYGSPQVPLMNRYTGRNVCAKAQEIREKNFCVISDGTTPTNGHPNTAAHEYESTFIEAWLRTL